VVFFSSGKSDTIANPGQHEYVMKSLKATGFHKVRLESFAGGHDIYHQCEQRNIMELIKNYRLSLRIAQTMRDLTKGN
jgi:hypothetical protein